MATGTELTPSEYIQHHLSFFQEPLGESSFWTLNVDSVLTSTVLGVLGFGFICGCPGSHCRRAWQAPSVRRISHWIPLTTRSKAYFSTVIAIAS